MELIRSLNSVKPYHSGCVLTIGNFDGVHLGHHSVLNQVKQQAKVHCLPSAVLVFEPQPAEVFNPQNAPARLTRWREKYTLLKQQHIERMVCLRFCKQFASLPADEFIEELLVNKLGVKHLVVGDDFKFGKGRKGDFSTLLAAGRKYGFTVEDTASCMLDNKRVSSTEVRKAIQNNDFELAERYLGRAYCISGNVIHGDKKGRTIGFPTVNILLRRCVSPVSGVYAVTVVHQGVMYTGVANAGHRPTVKGTRQQLEVHLFDFAGDLYGQRLDITFKHKIRDEQKFESFDALKEQIKQDAAQAIALLQPITE